VPTEPPVPERSARPRAELDIDSGKLAFRLVERPAHAATRVLFAAATRLTARNQRLSRYRFRVFAILPFLTRLAVDRRACRRC